MAEWSAESFKNAALFQPDGWEVNMATKPGLYANIHAKQQRIAAGSKEKMRPVGAKGAPTAKAFKESAKTAKKVNK
jgi:hypothetical protein